VIWLLLYLIVAAWAFRYILIRTMRHDVRSYTYDGHDRFEGFDIVIAGFNAVFWPLGLPITIIMLPVKDKDEDRFPRLSEWARRKA
jgi:hypothetical protein